MTALAPALALLALHGVATVALMLTTEYGVAIAFATYAVATSATYGLALAMRLGRVSITITRGSDMEDVDDREPLSPLDVIARDGWLSELVAPVPCAGGPAVARVTARLGGWRDWQDTADDIAIARVATDEGGDAADFRRVIAKIDREISDLEGYARLDVKRTGVVEPLRQQRIDVLVARRHHILALAAAGFPPSPI